MHIVFILNESKRSYFSDSFIFQNIQNNPRKLIEEKKAKAANI